MMTFCMSFLSRNARNDLNRFRLDTTFQENHLFHLLFAGLNYTPCTIWLTGPSGAGKTTTGNVLTSSLSSLKIPILRLDGDTFRSKIKNNDLSKSGAEQNAFNISETAKNGVFLEDKISVVSTISWYKENRDTARKVHESCGVRFVECFVNTPIAICEKRDEKGIYKRFRELQDQGEDT